MALTGGILIYTWDINYDICIIDKYVISFFTHKNGDEGDYTELKRILKMYFNCRVGLSSAFNISALPPTHHSVNAYYIDVKHIMCEGFHLLGEDLLFLHR